MGSLRRLPPERAHRGEVSVRAPAEQIEWQRMPLGICQMCLRVVYKGEPLALAGGSLLHGDCCTTAGEPTKSTATARSA